MRHKIKDLLKKKELNEDKKGTEFERGDFFAMMIALSMTMFPVLLGIFAVIGLLTWLLFT